MGPRVDAVLFAVLAVTRRARFGFSGVGRGLEVFAGVGDRRGVRLAPT
jgi:hypothetical protein